jgi:hypothetical protein
MMNSSITWDRTPCSPLKVNRRFGGIYSFHLRGRRVRQAWKQHEARSNQCFPSALCWLISYFTSICDLFTDYLVIQLLRFWILSIVLLLSKTHNVSERWFCLRLHVEPTQFGAIDTATPSPRKSDRLPVHSYAGSTKVNSNSTTVCNTQYGVQVCKK